jgi:hypothetical protein
MVDDLPEELHLAASAADRLPNLRQDVGLGPHPLVAAGIRNDAEAAELVAPFDDRDVRLHRIGTARDP